MNIDSVRSYALVQCLGAEVVVSVIIFGTFKEKGFALIARELSCSERTVCRKVCRRTRPCILIEGNLVLTKRNESGTCKIIKEFVSVRAFLKSYLENVF